jgi:hypothetical protein
MLKTCFEEQTVGGTQLSLFQVWKWCDFCWRHWMLRTCIDKKNRRQFGLSEGTCPHKNRRITVYEAANMWISFGAVQSVLKGNLNMYQIAAKFMPCLFKWEAGNETLVYAYDPETNQPSQWKSPSSPHPKKGKINTLKCEEHAHWSSNKELCIMNLFHKGKLWNSIFTFAAHAEKYAAKLNWKVEFGDWFLCH